MFQTGMFGEDFFIKQKKIVKGKDGSAVKIKKAKKAGLDYSTVPWDIMKKYASNDIVLTEQVATYYLQHIPDSMRRVVELETELEECIAEIEHHGFRVDTEFIKQYSDDITARLEVIEQKVFAEVGKFDMWGKDDLYRIIYDVLKCPYHKKTEAGNVSIDKEVLQEFKNPIAQDILLCRQLKVLKDRFLDKAIMEHQIDGMIFTNFNQIEARTGRMSSSEPNMQNMPSRIDNKMVRRAFIPTSDEYSILKADYSQIEYRIFAHDLNNANIIQTYKDGKDYHLETAIEIFNDASKRGDAKNFNFAMIYGQGDARIAFKLGITLEQAREIRMKYFARFPEYQGYMDAVKTAIYRRGYIKTILGRQRKIEPDKSYIGINSRIQGSAGDIFKLAVSQVHRFLRPYKTKIMNLVHDEMVFNLHNSEHHLIPEIKRIMEGVYPALRVPLVVELEIGPNWRDTKKIKL